MSKIPISAARELGRKHEAPVVVIFAIERDASRYMVTTWGRNRELCAWAASVSADIQRAVLSGQVCGGASHAENPRIEALEQLVQDLEDANAELRSELLLEPRFGEGESA